MVFTNLGLLFIWWNDDKTQYNFKKNLSSQLLIHIFESGLDTTVGMSHGRGVEGAVGSFSLSLQSLSYFHPE